MIEQDGPGAPAAAPPTPGPATPPPWTPPEQLPSPPAYGFVPPQGVPPQAFPRPQAARPVPGSPQRPRRGSRGLVAGLVVTLLLGLGAAVRTGSPLTPSAAPALAAGGGVQARASGAGTTTDPAFDAGAARILTTMTSRLQAHDLAGFTSVAAPGHPAVRERLRHLYTTLAALPLGSFSLELDTSRSSAPSSSPSGAWPLPVLAHYRLQGWDTSDVTASLTFTATRSADGTWGLAEDRTVPEAGADARLEPWVFDDAYVTRTPHVLVVGDRGHAQQARRLAGTLEQLVADVRHVWPERSWNGKVVAYAMTSSTFVRSWYGHSAAGDSGNGDRASFVAKVATLSPPSGSDGPGAVRMVVTPYLLGSPKAGYTDVLRHEVTHVATATLSSGVPVWLVEGAAEYTGFARRDGADLDPTRTFGEHGLTSGEVSATARGTWKPTLVAGDDFYTGSEKVVDERYNSAFITCLYVADHYGEATLRRLYEQAHTHDEASVLRQVLHTDRKHLLAAVGAYATTLRQRLVFR